MVVSKSQSNVLFANNPISKEKSKCIRVFLSLSSMVREACTACGILGEDGFSFPPALPQGLFCVCSRWFLFTDCLVPAGFLSDWLMIRPWSVISCLISRKGGAAFRSVVIILLLLVLVSLW